MWLLLHVGVGQELILIWEGLGLHGLVTLPERIASGTVGVALRRGWAYVLVETHIGGGLVRSTTRRRVNRL